MSAEKLRNINGPVYLTEESDHHNGEFIKAVDTDATDLTGPVYKSKDSGMNVFSEVYKQAQKVGSLLVPCTCQRMSAMIIQIYKSKPRNYLLGKNIQVFNYQKFS